MTNNVASARNVTSFLMLVSAIKRAWTEPMDRWPHPQAAGRKRTKRAASPNERTNLGNGPRPRQGPPGDEIRACQPTRSSLPDTPAPRATRKQTGDGKRLCLPLPSAHRQGRPSGARASKPPGPRAHAPDSQKRNPLPVLALTTAISANKTSSRNEKKEEKFPCTEEALRLQ